MTHPEMTNSEVTFFPEEAVREASRTFPTPFFLYSERRIRENCRRFRKTFQRHFPTFSPLYAVKANPNPHIARIMLQEGFGLDCSSESEAWLATQLNARGMYTGNYSTEAELRRARAANLIINLDDISALDILEDIGMPRTLSFRINSGYGEGPLATLVLAGPGAKFGVPAEQAQEAYDKAQALGVQEFGLHMMTGSNVLRKEYFSEVAWSIFCIMSNIRQLISFINIGGGFGVPYRPEEESLDIEKIAEQIRQVYEEFSSVGQPTLMAEPGRYLTADAGWLVTKVTSIKEGLEKKFVGVDAATNDMPRPFIYRAYHHVSVLDAEERPKETVSVVGGICENDDQFARDRELPCCRVGDTLIIHNCGGHAHAMGHNYNGRPRHAEYLLTKDGGIRCIRKAEEIEDLFINVPEWRT